MRLSDKKELIKLTLETMKECVDEGRFIVIQRDKNKDFITEYFLTREKQRDILLKIDINDYHDTLVSEKANDSYVNIFGPRVELVDSHGCEKIVDMYVKFETIIKSDGDSIVFISFHEQDYPLSYPFYK